MANIFCVLNRSGTNTPGGPLLLQLKMFFDHQQSQREGIVIFHSSKGPLDMIYSGKIDESGRFDLKIVNICKFRVFRPQNLEPFLRGTGENV